MVHNSPNFLSECGKPQQCFLGHSLADQWAWIEILDFGDSKCKQLWPTYRAMWAVKGHRDNEKLDKQWHWAACRFRVSDCHLLTSAPSLDRQIMACGNLWLALNEKTSLTWRPQPLVTKEHFVLKYKLISNGSLKVSHSCALLYSQIIQIN